MEIDTATRKMLLAAPPVAGYVGLKVFRHSLNEKIQGTGGRAIVVRRGGGWAAPDVVQSSEFPVVTIEIYADPDRDEYGNKIEDNAIDKAYAVYRVVDPLMHRVRDAQWGARGSDPGLRIFTSVRHAEPIHETQDDAHSQAEKALLEDCARVTVSYDIHTAH